MLTESRKRRRSCDSEEGQLLPQAKRSGGGHSLFPELGRDVWDSESSSSDSSGISSPERTAGASSSSSGALCVDSRGNYISQGPCSPASSTHLAEEPSASSMSQHGGSSYHLINRILRDAHFSSLQTRGQPGAT